MKDLELIVRVTSISESKLVDGEYDVTVVFTDREQPQQQPGYYPHTDSHHDHIHLIMKEAPLVGSYLCVKVNEASIEQSQQAINKRVKQQVIPNNGHPYMSQFQPQSVKQGIGDIVFDATLESSEISELKNARDRMSKILKKIDKKIKSMGGVED